MTAQQAYDAYKAELAEATAAQWQIPFGTGEDSFPAFAEALRSAANALATYGSTEHLSDVIALSELGVFLTGVPS